MKKIKGINIEEKEIIIIIAVAFLVTVIAFFVSTIEFNGSPGEIISSEDDCEGVFMDDRDNNEYRIVSIGDQCWFAENLRVDEESLDSLSFKEAGGEWEEAGNKGEPAYSAPENDPENIEDYGALYNWYAVEKTGLCPSGWSVPDDEDWHRLESHLSDEDQNCREDRTGSISCDFAGAKLKSESEHPEAKEWNLPDSNCDTGDEHDCSGFDSLPAGSRYTSGTSFNAGRRAYFWTATGDGENAWYRDLRGGETGVFRNDSAAGLGMSVRCIRD